MTHSSQIGAQVKDAAVRALRGNACALWVPPLGAIVDVLVRVSLPGPVTLENAYGLFFGLGVAGLLGLLMGAAWLIALGIPVLFGLILVRASHPLIAATVGGCLMYWLFYGRPTQTAIGAATALFAAINARSNPVLQRTASPPADLAR